MLAQAIQVRSNALLLFEQPSPLPYEHHSFADEPRKSYCGMMTDGTRKRLACALDILVQKNPSRVITVQKLGRKYEHRLGFLTLTLPNDKLISAAWGQENLVSKLIRYLRDAQGLKEYIWKVEFQQNGQVHWHFIIDEWIDWRVIRWKWNQLLRNERLLDRYALKNGHFNAPSIEIENVKDVVDLQKYLAKELCKSTFLATEDGTPVRDIVFDKETKAYRGEMLEDAHGDQWGAFTWNQGGYCNEIDGDNLRLKEATVDGKVWDCSERLKIGRFSTVMDWETSDKIYAAKRKGDVKIESFERYDLIKTMYPRMLLSKELHQEYLSHIN